jgi:hypothetical protein
MTLVTGDSNATFFVTVKLKWTLRKTNKRVLHFPYTFYQSLFSSFTVVEFMKKWLGRKWKYL